ncbi:mannose-6-phosphate isomerase, class I [Allorhizocola rhizosphaerae]|uniref:mannose-6-phosphate isomerase, class I n=1 Tax=Allorhizocola rhizosphaerae TaxID=1872709 RepID=UPI000E3E7082|nr:mannose-6-phosphate isomerase, class I [Allorhizocola rhizosphaerae]
MLRLQSQIRGYAWGSREVIARIQGRPTPSPGPEAELWVGAHPDNPSIVDGQPLDKLIAAAPAEYLGARAVSAFGPRLPYLMKLLAAERPLSVQVHPDARQAAEGHAAEVAAGVVERSYADPYHKPELLVALGDFEAMCGFRDPAESASALRGVDGLAPVVELLEEGRLEAALRTLLTMDTAKAVERVAQRDPLAARLARFYPGDVGVIVALLLNHVRLRAGEAVWMPPRTPHSYVEGVGVEAMAASDNVLRGGLTPKRVDVPELMRVLSFEPSRPPVVAPVDVAPGVVTWAVPVPDFRLHRVAVSGSPTRLDLPGPRTVLCLAGTVTVTDAAGAVEIRAGESAFGLADGGLLTFAGTGEAYVTSL